MKAFRFLTALSLCVELLASPSANASQASCKMPTAGPHTMAEVMATLNSCLSAQFSLNSGTSAPANNPSDAISTYQLWVDTTSNPSLLKMYDGAQSVTLGSLNTSTHVWLPYLTAGVSGGVPYFSATNVMGSSALLTNHGLVLGGGAGAAPYSMSVPASGTLLQGVASADPAFTPTPTLGVAGTTVGTLSFANATSGSVKLTPSTGALGSSVLTLPIATDTLIGKATTDTLTNKTYDTAGTGNAFSINGLAATANTGTGAVVRATTPTLVTPILGAATATTINGNTWTTGTGTLTLGASKTLTVSNTLTFTGTDGSTVAFGAGGTAAYTANNLSAFAATTSSQLAGVISDETGSGALVFGTTPTLTTPILGVASATSINKVAITAPASSATLTIPDGVTVTGPAASGTVMTLGNAETVTGAKSFNDATVLLKGSASGTTTLKAGAAAGTTTVTLPVATDTLVGKATTDTLTNKTFDTAGTGNSLSINGLAVTDNTGTGKVVRDTSPTIGGHATIEGVTATGATGSGKFVFDAAPTLSNPLVGTQSPGDNTTKAASTAFVQAAVTAATAGVATYNGRNGAVTSVANDVPISGYLSGLTLSAAGSTGTFGVAAGFGTDSTAASMMKLASAYTKTTSAWSVGSGNGALDTGAIANNTWYHVFIMQRPDTGVVDVCISVTVSACTTGGNIPASYTLFRRIGSMKTDGSAQWVKFTQIGDEFTWAVGILDINTSLTITATLYSLSVPPGVNVKARMRGGAGASAGYAVLFNSPDETSIAGGSIGNNFSFQNAGAASTGFASGSIDVMTDTSSRIRGVASTTIAWVMTTYAWIDRRGRD